jgi:hypothetical protein
MGGLMVGIYPPAFVGLIKVYVYKKPLSYSSTFEIFKKKIFGEKKTKKNHVFWIKIGFLFCFCCFFIFSLSIISCYIALHHMM